MNCAFGSLLSKTLVAQGTILLLSVVCFGQQTILKDVQNHAYDQVAGITSLKYSGRIEPSTGAIWQIEIERSGVKYRIRRVDEKPSLVNGEELVGSYEEYAFDGNRYQAMDERDSTMKDKSYVQLSDKQYQIGVADLVLRPFQWLTSSVCGKLNWGQIQSKELWDERFSLAIDRGEMERDGHKCRVVEIPQKCSDPPAYFRVYFSIDHDFFPIAYERYISSTNELSARYVMEESKTVSIDGRSIQIPIRGMRSEPTSRNPTGISRFFIAPDTLFVNPLIDDSRFVLTPSKTPYVYDIDEEERLAKESQAARRGPAIQIANPRRNAIVVGVNVFFAIALLWFIWRRSAK